ncbi:MAG: hypothetical protein JRJ68_01715 [Deltaproteobacteria bacterium]|nr:hypothetical protein [Deltaproteobacteria bacterium]
MIVKCPHCGKQLKMSAKIQESLSKLGPGRKIKIKCTGCQTPFGIDNSQLNSGSQGLQAPASPDIAWLREGVFEDREDVEDIPQALILMPEMEGRETVVEATKKLGYRVEMPSSAEEAISKMQFVNYAGIILHSRFEQGGIETGKFHQYMRKIGMSRRRYMLYVLIGKEFETLYDLQALACSANVVVNDAEIPYIGTVLRKAIPEYEDLFGGLMEELRIAGKE